MQIKLTLIAILTNTILNATTITGTAYADLEKESKKEALSDYSGDSIPIKLSKETIQ